MEILIVFLIIGGITAFIAVIVVLALRYERKRTAAMREMADSLGLTFFEKGDNQLQSRLQRFQLFNSGRARVMTNAIIGQTEIASIAIFDYRYTTGSGKNQTTYNQTVVAMESASLQLPSFTLRPENFLDKVGGALGFQDIDFDEHPEFSKMFVLKGQDEGAIREFFDQPLLDFFAGRPGIYFECAPGMFIYFRAGKRQKTEELRKYLEDGYSVYQAFTERLSRT